MAKNVRWGLLSVVIVVGLWQTVSTAGMLPAKVVPSPWVICADLVAQMATFQLWAAVWDTLSIALLGLAIAFAICIPLSLAMGLSRFVRESLFVPFEFIKPIPGVALLPLTLLLWGPSLQMKLALVTFGAIWPLLVQMTYGVREVDGVARDMARSYSLGPWLTIRAVLAPSLLPFTATGLRLSGAIALIVAVVTEMIGGVPGLGQEITLAQISADMPRMYALIVSAGILGLMVNGGLRILEKATLFWHPSQRVVSDG